MTSHPHTLPPRKLLAGWTLKLRVAALCLVLLVAGAWLAPPDTGTMVMSQERAAPLLEAQVQQRELPTGFRGLESVVAQLPHRGVTVHVPEVPGRVDADFASGRPAPEPAFGVVIDSGRVLSHAASLGGARSVTVALTDGGTVAAAVTAFDPRTGLVMLQLAEASGVAGPVASTRPEVGALVFAAVREGADDRVIPVFVSSVAPGRYRVTATQGLSPGMPVYNLAGELIAIADGVDTAWPIEHALGQVASADRSSSFGLEYQFIDAPLRPRFGDAGVIVVRVVADGPADAADIREGDVIAAVGGTTLSGGTDAAAVLSSQPAGSVTTITVRRGRRSLSLEARAVDAYAMAAVARVATTVTETSVPAEALFDSASLAAAGVPARAGVRLINGQPVSSLAQAKREVGRIRGDVVVLVEHRGRQSFALIGPAQ